MLEAFGHRQQALLRLLLERKAGMSVDELATALGIARTAVIQHLAVLERDGYIAQGELQRTGGRPGRTYRLSEHGVDLFPKHYAWFSRLLLEMLRRELGSEALVGRLEDLGAGLSADLQVRLAGKDWQGQVVEVVAIMNELGYEARPVPRPADGDLASIEAKNCIYHELAAAYPEVCHLDLALLSSLLDCEVDHQECMVRGGNACRFRLSPRSSDNRSQ